MFEFLKKKKIDDNEEIVLIDINNDRDIVRWFKRVGLDNISIKDILLRLGFNLDKKIYLKNISNQDGLSFYYSNDIDFSNKDRIDFYVTSTSRINCNYNYIISLSGNGYSKSYKIFCNEDYDNGFKLEKQRDMIMEEVNNKKYFREIEYYGFVIRVYDSLNREIIINCSGRFDLLIKNELELREYLTNIDISNVKVEDIYKKICEISLDDESKFSKVDLIIKDKENILGSIKYSKEDLHITFTSRREFKIKDNDRDITYIRYLPSWFSYDDRKNIKIVVSNGDYGFELEVNRNVYSGIATLDNEIGLRNYLLGLKFPINIIDVFNEICKITDIDGRDLKVRISSYYKDVETDILSFEYDKLRELKITDCDKEINYIDGLFSYKLNDKDRFIYVNIMDDEIVECGMNFSSGNGYNIKTDSLNYSPFNKEIHEACLEEENIKNNISKMLVKKTIKP